MEKFPVIYKTLPNNLLIENKFPTTPIIDAAGNSTITLQRGHLLHYLQKAAGSLGCHE